MKKIFLPAILLLLIVLSACQTSTAPTSVRTPVVIYEPTLPASTAIADQALTNAMQVLAQQLKLDLVQIKVISVESIDWPDACLGVALEGQMCAQAITPGYRIILEALGKQYDYHTDQSGANIVLASAPVASLGKPLLIWTSSTQPCVTAEIGLFGVSAGECGAALVQSMFVNGERVTELQAFLKTYQPFTAETISGKVVFNGTGILTASSSQQRSIAEWSNLVYMEAVGGRGGAAWGLAFTWHREGGIAGFCQDLAVYRDGVALAGTCSTSTPEAPQSYILNSEQLDQLYKYLDGYQSSEINRQDNPGGPDNMTVRMDFYGTGSQAFSGQFQQDLMAYASSLFLSTKQ